MTKEELRAKVVKTAEGYLGAKEGDARHKDLIDTYNGYKPLARGYKMTYKDAWCAAFTSAIFIKAGLVTLTGTECSCSKFIEIFKSKGIWKEEDNYTPAAGDLILYNWNDSGSGDCSSGASHIGIVVSCSSGKIKVIEGNKNNAVEYRTISVNGRYIRGFAVPKYETMATVAESTVSVDLHILKAGSKGTEVRALQALLNNGSYYKDNIDGSFGAATTAAVKAFQSAKGLTVDGSVGLITWRALLGL